MIYGPAVIDFPSVERASSILFLSSGFALKIRATLGRSILPGSLDQAITQDMKHARYSSFTEKLELQEEHDGTTGSSAG